MKGVQHVVVHNARVQFRLELVLPLAKMKGAGLFLPESFEWLVLDSGVVRDDEIGKILDDPLSYIESRNYFSWENYFTDLLARKTAGTYLQYGKSSLNKNYFGERELSLLSDEVVKLGAMGAE